MLQIGGKKEPADHCCRLGLIDHFNESGEPDMLVRSISFEQLLPVMNECRVGQVMGLANGLHLVSQFFGKHLLKAVLNNIVSGIEGNATTSFCLWVSCVQNLWPVLVEVIRLRIESSHTGILVCLNGAKRESCFLILILLSLIDHCMGQCVEIKRIKFESFIGCCLRYSIVKKNLCVCGDGYGCSQLL